MFSFLCKKKTIVVDCFTNRADVYEYSKIDYANNFIPKWFKQVPTTTNNTFFPSPTIRTCPGFTGLYKEGIIIPMWSDLAIKVGKEGTNSYQWQFSDKTSNAEDHPQEQRGSYMPDDKYAHLKLVSPWLVKTNKLVKFLWIQPSWNFNDFSSYHVVPGVTEYKYQNGTNINLFIKRQKEDSVINIEFGQPLAHIIPMENVNIELKHHLISNEEYDRMYQLHSNISFVNKYFNIKRCHG